jgi:hypothetical protein
VTSASLRERAGRLREVAASGVRVRACRRSMWDARIGEGFTDSDRVGGRASHSTQDDGGDSGARRHTIKRAIAGKAGDRRP